MPPKYFKINEGLEIKERGQGKNLWLSILRGNKTQSLHRRLMYNYLSTNRSHLTQLYFPHQMYPIKRENDIALSPLTYSRPCKSSSFKIGDVSRDIEDFCLFP